MLELFEAHTVKLDSKGRLPLPMALRRSLDSVLEDGFVIKRSIHEKCLELYPMEQWRKNLHQIYQLSQFKGKNQRFVRQFFAGVKVVQVDSNGRINIPKVLSNFAKLVKEVEIAPAGTYLEIWDKVSYEEVLIRDEADFAALAEEVMGNESENGNELS